MRVTIVPVDGVVSINGELYSGLDLSFIDSSINAIQWYANTGEIEIKDERGSIISNIVFNDLDQFQPAIQAWTNQKNKLEQEAAKLKLEQEAAELIVNESLDHEDQPE
jgi:hypothetical protein